ncbi:hypothetical protein ACET9Q_13425 [Aeromonas caviae]|uniref:hypothetical protein n=1 Tax=Aeromonas TaxID=642 RepID=UPI002E7B965F|nr:hypothetical protein [Aeromonas caviae]MEE1914650.1 hypothetical protein [Aeromonas caviae]
MKFPELQPGVAKAGPLYQFLVSRPAAKDEIVRIPGVYDLFGVVVTPAPDAASTALIRGIGKSNALISAVGSADLPGCIAEPAK